MYFQVLINPFHGMQVFQQQTPLQEQELVLIQVQEFLRVRPLQLGNI